MLLKRLDVTIQSFLWGASVQDKQDEVLAVIDAQRQYLTEAPATYSVRSRRESNCICLLYVSMSVREVSLPPMPALK